jgi:mono/diheme cytochrome c family protein
MTRFKLAYLLILLAAGLGLFLLTGWSIGPNDNDPAFIFDEEPYALLKREGEEFWYRVTRLVTGKDPRPMPCSNSLKQIALLSGAEPEVDSENLRPGLVAIYRDTAAIEIGRLEPTIALALKANEAPHPRLAATGGTISYSGYLNVLRAGNYRFSATLRGRFRLQVAGKEVLAAEVKEETPALRNGPEVRLEAGVHPLNADFTRLPGIARLELFWQAPHVRREPLPYDHLGHLSAQETVKLADGRLAERGRLLAEENNCTRCHVPADGDRVARGLLSRQGPDLSQVGRRVYAGWLYAWLESPQKVHPGAAMPQLFNADQIGRAERYAVVRYLSSLGGPLQPDSGDGLQIHPTKKTNPKDIQASAMRGQRLFTGLGCVACHRPESPKQPGADRGVTTGSTNNWPLGDLGNKTTVDQLAAYLTNPLAVDPSGRMPHILLQGNEARDLATYLCQAKNPAIATAMPPPPAKDQILAAFQRVDKRAEELAAFQRLSAEAQLVDLGKRVVIEKGCNNCHTIAPGAKAFANLQASASFEDIKRPQTHTSGCLAPSRDQQGKSPWFGFSEIERKALRLFLRDGTSGAGSLAPAYAARVALQRFNCFACHARDGIGGLTPDLIEDLRRVEKAENSEAVSPPPLTGVGHKLRTPWMKQVLTQAGRARPWMGLRMPQFGEANVGWLPEALAALEGTEASDQVYQVAITAANIGAGRQLVGKSGFGCISCHDIAGIPNTGTRGPDLALMNQRVRHDWYQRWLEQAQRMQPGTRMPTIFFEGKSLLPNILGGSPDAQADAMWAYLSLGMSLPLPEGLEPPKGLIVTVKDRPILLRTFMPEAGPRALAVGYPGGLSVAFDATACSLAYMWSGNFLDASPVWDNRGGNPAKVLGQRVWRSPPGCPWAVTNSTEPPDFAARAKDPAYGASLPEGEVYQGPRHLKFEGYSTDKAGFPAFHYRLQTNESHALEVTERAEPLPHPIAVGLARRFTLQVSVPVTPWFLAGTTTRTPRVLDSKGTPLTLPWNSGRVETPASRCLLVLPQEADRVTVLEVVAVPDGTSWEVRRSGNTWQALVRLPTPLDPAKWQLGLHVWVLPRDEPSLLKELAPRK